MPRGEKLLLAVQTEKLVIDGENRHADANRLSCRVTEVLYQGESLRVFNNEWALRMLNKHTIVLIMSDRRGRPL